MQVRTSETSEKMDLLNWLNANNLNAELDLLQWLNANNLNTEANKNKITSFLNNHEKNSFSYIGFIIEALKNISFSAPENNHEFTAIKQHIFDTLILRLAYKTPHEDVNPFTRQYANLKNSEMNYEINRKDLAEILAIYDGMEAADQLESLPDIFDKEKNANYLLALRDPKRPAYYSSGYGSHALYSRDNRDITTTISTDELYLLINILIKSGNLNSSSALCKNLFGEPRTQALIYLCAFKKTIFDPQAISRIYSLPEGTVTAYHQALRRLINNANAEWFPAASDSSYLAKYLIYFPQPILDNDSSHPLNRLADMLVWLGKHGLSTPVNQQTVFYLIDHLQIFQFVNLQADENFSFPKEKFLQMVFDILMFGISKLSQEKVTNKFHHTIETLYAVARSYWERKKEVFVKPQAELERELRFQTFETTVLMQYSQGYDDAQTMQVLAALDKLGSALTSTCDRGWGSNLADIKFLCANPENAQAMAGIIYWLNENGICDDSNRDKLLRLYSTENKFLASLPEVSTSEYKKNLVPKKLIQLIFDEMLNPQLSTRAEEQADENSEFDIENKIFFVSQKNLRSLLEVFATMKEYDKERVLEYSSFDREETEKLLQEITRLVQSTNAQENEALNSRQFYFIMHTLKISINFYKQDYDSCGHYDETHWSDATPEQLAWRIQAIAQRKIDDKNKIISTALSKNILGETFANTLIPIWNKDGSETYTQYDWIVRLHSVPEHQTEIIFKAVRNLCCVFITNPKRSLDDLEYLLKSLKTPSGEKSIIELASVLSWLATHHIATTANKKSAYQLAGFLKPLPAFRIHEANNNIDLIQKIFDLVVAHAETLKNEKTANLELSSTSRFFLRPAKRVKLDTSLVVAAAEQRQQDFIPTKSFS
jgi:hypothetical protein